ncbi:hypothetical protein LX36DRAFT_120675 [Colletotrichum falcatum]|nr:hypothetical protein LX36DRAFT_120675 [Colletotrichum falcatum]
MQREASGSPFLLWGLVTREGSCTIESRGLEVSSWKTFPTFPSSVCFEPAQRQREPGMRNHRDHGEQLGKVHGRELCLLSRDEMKQTRPVLPAKFVFLVRGSDSGPDVHQTQNIRADMCPRHVFVPSGRTRTSSYKHDTLQACIR